MPPRRLNQDANYKEAVGDVIGFKQAGFTRLVKVRVLLPPCALVSSRAHARHLHRG